MFFSLVRSHPSFFCCNLNCQILVQKSLMKLSVSRCFKLFNITWLINYNTTTRQADNFIASRLCLQTITFHYSFFSAIFFIISNDNSHGTRRCRFRQKPRKELCIAKVYDIHHRFNCCRFCLRRWNMSCRRGSL